MNRHIVLYHLLFLAGLILFLGISKYPNDNYSITLFGYGRFSQVPTYLAIFALLIAAGWNRVQWRRTLNATLPPLTSFVLANVWYFAAAALMLGQWAHPTHPRDVTLFGYGHLEPIQPDLTAITLLVAAFSSLREWRKAGRPEVTNNYYFVAANVCFFAAVALLLGIGPYPGNSRYETIYGYGPIEQFPAYAATGAVFAAALWHFVLWRKTAGEPGAVPPAETGESPRTKWAMISFGLIWCTVVMLLASSTGERWQPPVVSALADHGGAVSPEPARPAPVTKFTTGTIACFSVFVLLMLAFLIIVTAKKQAGAPVPPVTAPKQRPQTSRSRNKPTEPVGAPEPAVPPPSRTCPKCHSSITADAAEGLCPRCLMAGAFQSVLSPSRTGPYGGPVAPPAPEEVQEHFPNLEILGLIGQGGMGAVYQARQPNLDRIVALKLIRPREDNPMFAERFVREAKAMAKLSHPNVVHIHESGEAGGSLYLIMEFVDGVTLREAIRAKVIPAAEALKIVGQLCDALEYAHAQGVVHRDIKPENILLDRSGKVKVVDFGLAKLANDSAMSLTHTRQAMGTPHYMAPEQWEKPTEVDHRADIYALGVVIYELLTGELPLGRFDPPSVKSRLDARIDEIVLRLLAKEPDRRYQNASEVRTALFNLGQVAVAVPNPAGGGRNGFYEYKSKTEYFGWPLVHIVLGNDPRTGNKRLAKGWIAVGDVMAVGVVAVSGMCSIGLLSVGGGVSFGLLALAGFMALGGLSIGGMAIGAVSVGGLAFGWLACGGVAIGRFAIGGSTVGDHQYGGNHQDADFWEQLRDRLPDWFG